MKNKWPAKPGLSLLLTGAVSLLGCISLAQSSGSDSNTNANAAPSAALSVTHCVSDACHMNCRPHRQPKPELSSPLRFTSCPATVAYAHSYPSGQINEYSTVPADKGSLIGTLTLPTPYTAADFATDSSGQIYVAACGPTNPVGVVFVFPPNSIGAAAPSSTIEIGSCGGGVSDIVMLAVDPAGQYLYVETPAGANPPQTISVYPTAASGAPVPIRTLQLPIGVGGWMGDFTADADGDIFVAGAHSSYNGIVNVYGPTAAGSDVPIRTITFENAQSMPTATSSRM